jgi:L,D-peptidoglycan transpeptidase YkuD (ErfK/YbiS/YcfS/YnhG family)
VTTQSISRFIARSDGTFTGGGLTFRCALGKGGVVDASDKREGDGASPIGVWPIRRVWYRPDRVSAPKTQLDIVPLKPSDGWCDASADPLYNRPVLLPYPASHEEMWKPEAVYDLVAELGYNDDPVVPGLGSAIFMHIARDNYAPTEGCVALSQPDLQSVLELCGPGSEIEIAR